MTNYEKIKKIIEAGHIAQAYDKYQDEYTLYLCITQYAMIRRSLWKSHTEDCLTSLGEASDSSTTINNYTLDISIYQKPVRYPKVGDKVEILESVKETTLYNNGSKEREDMIGGPFIVEGAGDSSCRIYNKDTSNSFPFDYRHVAPRIHDDKEEEEKEKETLSGKTVTVLIDGKEHDAVIQ